MEPAVGIRPRTARSQMGVAVQLSRLARRGFRGVPGLALVLIGLLGNIITTANSAEPAHRAMSDEFIGFNFRKEHGLPDDDIRDILQTRDGYLWVLTQEGIARFDGAGFTVYDRPNTPDFQNDDPRVLAEDSEGRLWVGGKNMVLRMTGNSFQRVTLAEGRELVHGYQLCPDPQGGMWIGGDSTLAYVRDGKADFFGSESGLEAGGAVCAMQFDATAKLWLSTFSGFFEFDAAQKRFARVSLPGRAPEMVITALALHAGRSGQFWGMFAAGRDAKSFPGFLGWVESQQGSSWAPPMGIGTTNFVFGPGLKFIFEDRSGNVWLPGEPNEIHRIRAGSFETLELIFPRGPDLATCVREDHEGSLWMGTLRGGLWRWQPRRMKAYSTADGLPHENVWALCEGKDGEVWVGTDGGLARRVSGRWETWKTEQGLSRDNIRALAVDREGTVWIGTGEGLNSLRDGKVVRHPFPGDWFESKIRVILPTRDGAVWVAGAASLHRLSGGEEAKFTTAEGLANNDVRALLEDTAGRLWIGTFGGGLQCYEHGRFTSYSTTNGLASGYVWALHQDADGSLWIGTESGLHRLREGRITAFGKAQGLPDNLVNFILEDDLGQLWISHDRGIYRVRRAALDDVAEGRTNIVHCVSYTKADGLPSEETNGQKSYPAACKTHDGRLWFATTKGVVVIDPKLHHEEQTPPPVVIERFRATGDLVFTRDPQEPLSLGRTDVTNAVADRAMQPPGTSDGNTLRLSPGGGRVVEFTFTANTFVSADRARFKYRLLGLDEKWVEAGARRQALFTNLKPGNYRFQVIAANHHGVWNESGATCAFYIAPFFHETWWFYLCCGGTALTIIGGFVVWRLRELTRIHRLEGQAAVAAERLRIAQDLHDGLGADLTRLSALAELASDPSTQTSRDQLRKLARTSRETTRGLKDLIWMANPANDTLDSFLDRLCQNSEDFLRDSQIRCRFDIAPDLPPLPLSLEQRRNLLLVAREALNNVAKHSAASEVRISVQRREGSLELSIQDNGRGFDSGVVRPGAMGLTGMRRRIESLGCKFRLESAAGTGTGIWIQLKWQTAVHAKPQE